MKFDVSQHTLSQANGTWVALTFDLRDTFTEGQDSQLYAEIEENRGGHVVRDCFLTPLPDDCGGVVGKRRFVTPGVVLRIRTKLFRNGLQVDSGEYTVKW